ncbi:MAG: isoprenoid biosynthesis glyoxalase ElbB [candidate division KSB1 bacterium]|nr:isoprenoid biosynthesis glyoxalase ElbB [candidate division KSB1 bacterium]MDZ7317696.1 isoprenoid biosynthesis glyoxalase ElbB [candidate division KSB1 bacterium]MDZ7340153.1 isoprenoid biosynthesis glyoxalase ElbB [candidate division KSB1 bacterium]
MALYNRKRIGVVLSGCGVYDGAEIHEAVLTLLNLDQAGATIICMAPDIRQMHVINHLKGEPAANEVRNVLIEAARIARGEIKSLKQVDPKEIDAVIFPGGYGAAKNLCTFAVDGDKCKVNAEVEQLILALHQAKKPMGFICIAPVIAAKVLAAYHPLLTIGNDSATAAAIESMGGKHVNAKVDEIVTDEVNKIVSTPAYMLGPTIAHVARGIEKCVLKVLEMTK